VERRIAEIAEMGRKLINGDKSFEGLESMSQYLNTAANLFTETDNIGGKAIGDVTCMPPINNSGIVGIPIIGGMIIGGQRLIGIGLDWFRDIIGIGSNEPNLTTKDNNGPEGSVTSVTTETKKTDNFREWPDDSNQDLTVKKTDLKTLYGDDKRVVAVDSFRGVSAEYSKDSIDPKVNYTVSGYQCSDYIKKFYAQAYDIDSKGNTVKDVIINDLLYKGCETKDNAGHVTVHDGIPNYQYTIESTGEKMSGAMQSVTTPQAGDILSVDNGEHWAIVKAVEGGNVIVIEQNYHSSDGSVTINHQYEISKNTFYRIP
jgi:hypothetical protein